MTTSSSSEHLNKFLHKQSLDGNDWDEYDTCTYVKSKKKTEMPRGPICKLCDRKFIIRRIY